MRKSIPLLTLILFLSGGVIALFGTYWDDAWHTDRGRDSFTTPPHLLLYGGVLLIGASAAWWALLVLRRERRIQAIISQPPLVLTLIGDVITLAAAPIDNAWHLAFGRDAVLWSPPHLLGVVGMLAVGSGMLLVVSARADRLGALLTGAVGAAVLGAALVPVMEYEADVPQFAAVWYLPILTVGSLLAFALLRAASPQRWIGTVAATLYTALRIGIVIFLLLLGFSRPLIPLIILPTIVFDLTAHRRWPGVLRAGLFALAVYASYVPYLNLVLSGVALTWSDVLVGLPLAVFVGWLVLRIVEGPRPTVRQAQLALLLLGGVILLFPGQALAHDPGQGPEIGKMQLTATLHNAAVDLTAVESDRTLCDQLEPRRLEARRAGKVVTALLSQVNSCQFVGTITLPERGNWFVYAELTEQQQPVETWLPVQVGADQAQFAKLASLYQVETTSGSALEVVSSIVLYTGSGIALGGILLVFRRQHRKTSTAASIGDCLT